MKFIADNSLTTIVVFCHIDEAIPSLLILVLVLVFHGETWEWKNFSKAWKLGTEACNVSECEEMQSRECHVEIEMENSPPEWLVCCCCCCCIMLLLLMLLLLIICCGGAIDEVVLLLGITSCVHLFDEFFSKSLARATVSIISAVWWRPQ